LSDFVQVKVSVPKGLVEFLRDLSAFGGCKLSPKAWAERELVEAARATIDQLDDGEYLDRTRLYKKYGLEPKAEDP